MSIFKLGLIGKTPPGKFKDIVDHLTRVKKKKSNFPDVFFANELPIPVKKQNVEEIEAINRFTRDNPRKNMDEGGSVKFYPKASGSISGKSEIAPGIDLSTRDINYGGTVMYEGDKFYGGVSLDKGKVKFDVTDSDGTTLFKDTLSKDDAVNFIVGLGDPKGEKFQVKADKDFTNVQLTFRKNFAGGGRIGFKDGPPRKIYKVARPITDLDRKNNPDIPKDAKFKMQVPAGKFRGSDSSTMMIYDTSEENLNKRLKDIESNVYVKPSKPREPIPDDRFLVKKSSKRIKENINKIEYEEVLGKKNQPNTFKPTGKTVIRYKPFIGPDKITIPGQGAKTLKEAQEFVKDYFKANPKKVRIRDPEKDYRAKDIRRRFEKDLQGRQIDFGAKKGYVAHHMLPLAGKADITDSDIAIISNKMNAELAQFDKPMNALVNEAYALDFSKEGSLKRMDEINKELAEIVKKAEKKLPKKYEGLIGFNKLTPVLGEFDAKGNQVFDIERIGADYKKSIGQKKIGIPLRDIKRSEIRKLVSEAPTFGALDVPLMFRTLKPATRKLVGGAGGFILPEVLFYQLDKRNRMSKGQSEKEAAAGALESGTLGAYENKAYMEELKKVAESMNIDSSSFDAAYQLNLLTKSYNQNNANYEKNFLQLLEMGDEKRAEDLKKNFDRYTKETQNKYSLLSNNISDNVMNTVGASPLIMKEGRENITQEQFEKPFYDIRDTALEKLKREKQKAFDTQKRQVDTAAGSVGENFYQTFDSLTQGAKNILQGRVIPFASKIGLPQYEPLESDREREARYLKEMDPRELFLYNKERGFTYDQPITAADIENLQYENPGLFAGGGIAKEAGDSSGPPPASGPNPQGLLSLKNRGRNL